MFNRCPACNIKPTGGRAKGPQKGQKRMTNLKKYRERAGITQAELAKRTGVSLRTLQDYEQGRKPINQAAAITVYRIARALDVNVEDILES